MGRSKRRRSATPWQRRRRRAVIGLGILALVLAPLIVWRLQLRADINQRFADIRARGLPLTVSELAAWEVHAPDEAAADAALEAVFRDYHEMDLQTFGQLPRLYGEEPLLLEVPYPSALRSALESRVRGNESMLERLADASAFSHFRTVRDLGKDFWGNSLSIDRPMEVLFARACLLAEDGQGDAALNAIMTGIKVARACRATPLIQAFNVAMSSERRILSAIYPVSVRATLSREKLGEFWTLLEDSHWSEDLERATIGQRCTTLTFMGRADGPMGVLSGIAGFQDIEVRKLLQFVDEVPALAKLSSRGREDYLAADRAYYRYAFWWGESPAREVNPVVIAALQYRRAQGALPDQPEVLVPVYLDAVPLDPEGKGPVKIRHDEVSITVYGVGPNGADDGGKAGLDTILAGFSLKGGLDSGQSH